MATLTVLETDPRSKSVRVDQARWPEMAQPRAMVLGVLAYDPFQWLFTTSTYKEVMGK